MTEFISDPLAQERWQVGPLGAHVGAFARRLQELGYATTTAQQKLRVVAKFSRWLEQRKLLAVEVDEQIVARYLARWGRPDDSATLADLLEALRESRVVPRPTRGDETQLERLEREFGQYLAVERGLSEASLKNSLPFVRSFVAHRFGSGPISLDDVRAPDVTRFLLRKLQTSGAARAKLMVGALRSFFRFLRWRGDIAIDLASSVPRVADWRLSALPKSLPAGEVERLISSCHREATTTGQRDYTVLLLLARLGLRAAEVVDMTLDDIDWEAGELTVRGKGGREDRLPIPCDVGQAMATYLRQGRPQDCSTRRFFVRRKAPRRGFASSVAVCTIVRRALERAGIASPRKGAHLLRHSLATEMLRKGASLGEIGEILRHRSLDTTAIYAKVDLVALRALAQPWPSGGAA